MKKSMISYGIGWVLSIILFNMVCFVTPDEMLGISKFERAFWAQYIFITIAFVLHLALNLYLFHAKNKDEKILSTPLMVISYAELLIVIIAGSVCMLIPNLPNWVGIVICYLVLVVSIVYLLSVKTVGEYTHEANRELNNKTFAFRVLIDEAQMLGKKATTPEIKQIVKEVYEAIRYSDLVSAPELAAEEEEIWVKLRCLSEIISAEEKKEKIAAAAKDLLLAIEVRNNKCKAIKRKI